VVSRRLGVPKTQGSRVQTFARIGSFVGRRYKLIIVFWILLFAASFPLSQQLSQVTTSSTSGGQSSTSQSALGQNLLAQEFPHPQSNASAIILLQGNDVTDNATKIFALRLERSLLAPGVLNSLENVTTIYSIERTALTLYYLQNYSYPVAQSKANQTVWHETLSQYPPLIPPTIIQNFISLNKNAMIILVTFSQAPGSFGSADTDPILKNVVTMRNIISQLKASDPEPLQTYVTGDLATTADSSLGSTADLGRIEPVTVGAILILSGLFFLAIVTPFVPLATVGMALLMGRGRALPHWQIHHSHPGHNHHIPLHHNARSRHRLCHLPNGPLPRRTHRRPRQIPSCPDIRHLVWREHRYKRDHGNNRIRGNDD